MEEKHRHPAALATLRITEIFSSLQGESTRQGLPTTFIRLSGCPLRCAWCDSEFSFPAGETKTVAALLDAVKNLGQQSICVTGGEPLAQKNVFSLLRALCDADFLVSLETSGALPIEAVDKRVAIVMDLKAPDSLECDKNHWENLLHLQKKDEIKFVLASRKDYDWAREQIHAKQLLNICPVIFSPVTKSLDPLQLADWLVADRLAVRMQLQLHKILWNDARRK